MKLDTIAIYRPNDTCIFQVGENMVRNGEKTDMVVKKITRSFFGTVKVFFSNKEIYIFKGFPVSYEK